MSNITTDPELIFALTGYFSLAGLSFGIQRFGREGVAAGLVGMVLTFIYGLTCNPTSCTSFETWNAVMAYLIIILFVFLFMARDYLAANQNTTNV